jgi:hypothetical protein
VELSRSAVLSEEDSVGAARADHHRDKDTTTTRGIEAMPKRPSRASSAALSSKPPEPAASLRQALAKRKKAELVDLLMELADTVPGIHSQSTCPVG